MTFKAKTSNFILLWVLYWLLLQIYGGDACEFQYETLTHNFNRDDDIGLGIIG